MNIDKAKQKFLTELNEFVKTLDENVREAAFKFLLGEPTSEDLIATPLQRTEQPVGRVAERDISPQELLRQSNANSNMAKAEVLAYWLEAHQGKTTFSSGDLKDAFLHAREPAPKNASDVVAKLASAGKLMPAEKVGAIQYYRLTRTALEEVREWLGLAK
jgi:hypothetical protein